MVKDGNEQILVLEAVEGGGGSHPGGDVLYYLTGQWGVCGKPLFEFKSTDEGDFLTIHDGEGTYTLKYKYDSQNGQIYLSLFEYQNGILYVIGKCDSVQIIICK